MLLHTRVPFQVTALATRSHGAVVDGFGIDLTLILAGTDLPLRVPPPMASLPADVLVEMTPLDPITGEPALTYIRGALTAGMHVVTANKGPIARGYREREALSERQGRLLRVDTTIARWHTGVSVPQGV